MALLYERARYTEALQLPRGVIRLIQVVTAVLAFGSGIAAWLLSRQSSLWPLACLPVLIPTMLCAALATAGGSVSVYPDRLEVVLAVFGRAFKRYRFLWQEVEAIEVQAKSLWVYSVLRRAPGLTIIMYGKSGIRVHLANGSDVLIGSSDPNRLLSAIKEYQHANN